MNTSLEPSGRLTAFGNQLIEVHHWLREELRRLQTDVDAFLGGRGDRPRDLRAHCLTFCSALDRHHTGEDGGAFLVLAEQLPEIRPVLEQLEHDHQFMAGILRRVQELVGGLDAELGPAEAGRVQAELDGLAAIMESHFSYEERKIVSILNSLDVPAWDHTKPDFLKLNRAT